MVTYWGTFGQNWVICIANPVFEPSFIIATFCGVVVDTRGTSDMEDGCSSPILCKNLPSTRKYLLSISQRIGRGYNNTVGEREAKVYLLNTVPTVTGMSGPSLHNVHNHIFDQTR